MKFTTYFKDLFSTYDTVGSVRIRTPIVATVSRILLLATFVLYLKSIDMDLSRMYTVTCEARGAVLTKVKGFTSTEHLTPKDFHHVKDPNVYIRTWDATDLVFPTTGGEGHSGDFSVVTNLLITPNQTRGSCPQNLNNHTRCSNDSDCSPDAFASNDFWSGTNGLLTGKCVNDTGTCEVAGWCPIEQIRLPRKGRKPLLEGVANFTVVVKVTVDFPECGEGTRFVTTNTRLLDATCLFDNARYEYCPRFSMGFIVRESGYNFNDIAMKGGIFRLRVDYDCDFTFGKSIRTCLPKYKFNRVASVYVGKSEGWSFRSVEKHSRNNRTITTHYGLKLLIDVEGEGLVFDFFTLVNNLGSLLGLSCLTPLICDFLLEICNWFSKSCNWSRKLHERYDHPKDEESPQDDDNDNHDDQFQMLKLKLLLLLTVVLLVLIWAVQPNSDILADD